MRKTMPLIKIKDADMPQRLEAKEAGKRWNPKERLWLANYGNIATTPRKEHLQASTGRCRPVTR